MIVQSLVNLVEATKADPAKKNLSGNISDLKELMTHENLIRLEKAHEGIFAFMAFHPGADKALTEYIGLGSLASDAGDYVLALFTLGTSAYRPRKIDFRLLESTVAIDHGEHPAYDLVRFLFPKDLPPRLPGILFIEKFSSLTEPVFVSLEKSVAVADVVARVRLLFEMATRSYVKTKEDGSIDFVHDFSTRLAAGKIDYRRGEAASMTEWLIKGYYRVRQNLGDIVSVVKLLK